MLNINDLRTLVDALDDKPVGPQDRWYFPFDKEPSRPRGWDAAGSIESLIELKQSNTTCQLFTGLMGTGKSSELLRLKTNLEAKGFDVVMLRGGDYINLHQSPEITDILLSMAAGVAVALEALDKKISTESPWKKLVNFLTANVELGDLSIKAGPLEFGGELRTNETFKQRIQNALRGRLKSFTEEVQVFMDQARKILGCEGVSKAPVLIIDDLEKIQGSGADEVSVKDQVEQIFAKFNWALKISGWHMVWTAPHYLRLMNRSIETGYDGCQVLPMVRLWDEDPARTKHRQGIEAIQACLARRGDFRSLFDDDKLFEELIMVSSGHMRDLVKLLRDLVVTSNMKLSQGVNPVINEQDLNQVIQTYVANFRQSVYEQDKPWLRQIAETRELKIPDSSMIPRATKLLDNAVVVSFKQNRLWYDVHYSLREDL